MFLAITVLDFGGQYCHLVARRVRDLGVYSEILPGETVPPKEGLEGIILSGGPSSVYGQGAPHFNEEILSLGVPILGLCYGHQLIAKTAGGDVKPAGNGEYGSATISVSPKGILAGCSNEEKVWMSHGDAVLSLPSGFETLASTDGCPIAAYQNASKKLYGLQFHPEVVHTPAGTKIFGNFLNICGCKRDWRMDDFTGRSVAEAKNEITGKAIIALSGGVDSSTAAALVSKAIGKRLTAVFVDTGFMRLNEPELVRRAFENILDLRMIDASERFYSGLAGVTDPEQKRKIIGEQFIREFEAVAREIGADVLVQGTIYPDRVESASTSKSASKIKSHHNVAGLPADMKLRVYEPLRDLYKDEVRIIASKLGLPEEIVQRHPFPGPGLAIRILGEPTRERAEILKRADEIVIQEIRNAGLYEKTWQAFAVLLPVKSVGVQGDSRTYGNTIAIRAVDSVDGMTASFSRIPWDVLETISTRITNEVREANRVVYDITHKPPGTIEWE